MYRVFEFLNVKCWPKQLCLIQICTHAFSCTNSCPLKIHAEHARLEILLVSKSSTSTYTHPLNVSKYQLLAKQDCQIIWVFWFNLNPEPSMRRFEVRTGLITYRETGLVIEHSFNSHLLPPPEVSSQSNKKQKHNDLVNWESKQDNSDLSETEARGGSTGNYTQGVIIIISSQWSQPELWRWHDIKKSRRRQVFWNQVSGCFVNVLILSSRTDIMMPTFYTNLHFSSPRFKNLIASIAIELVWSEAHPATACHELLQVCSLCRVSAWSADWFVRH